MPREGAKSEPTRLLELMSTRIQQDRALTQKLSRTRHPIEFTLHVRPGTATAEILKGIRQVLATAGSYPFSPQDFPDRIIIVSMLSMFNDIHLEKKHNSQGCRIRAREGAKNFRPRFWCFIKPKSEESWKYTESPKCPQPKWRMGRCLHRSGYPVFPTANISAT